MGAGWKPSSQLIGGKLPCHADGHAMLCKDIVEHNGGRKDVCVRRCAGPVQDGSLQRSTKGCPRGTVLADDGWRQITAAAAAAAHGAADTESGGSPHTFGGQERHHWRPRVAYTGADTCRKEEGLAGAERSRGGHCAGAGEMDGRGREFPKPLVFLPLRSTVQTCASVCSELRVVRGIIVIVICLAPESSH